MNFLLEVTDYTKPVENLLDRLTFGGTMLLIGISIVFLSLIVIWGVLSLFKLFFNNEGKKEEQIEQPAVVQDEATDNDEEIIAVIAAAITAAESESNGLKFKVVSFRRK